MQLAFFNGDGIETWQNVWGIWNGIEDADSEAMRRIGNILRFFGKRGFLQSRGWVPHTPMVQTASAGIFASAWPLHGEVVWTVVNRGQANSTGIQIEVDQADNRNYYDCYRGMYGARFSTTIHT
jgi:hypothetical protein